MRALFLKLHLGLGDLILANGLIRVLVERHDRVIVPVKTHNLATAQWMFSDDKRIEICAVGGDQEMLRQSLEWPSLGLGIWSKEGLRSVLWCEQWYEQADVPFETRWSAFNLPWKTLPSFTPHWPIFWHDDPERGYQIALAAPKYCIYMPSSKEPFQNHIRPLQSATEIHVIDSCFLCLADSIATNAKRLVLHRYATAKDPYKRLGQPTLRKNWEIIE